jgi:hypothetical protein
MPSQTITRSTDPPQECLTPGDRALLNAVFGWHMPGAASIAPSMDARGKPVLIPLMAWVIADARRHGDVDGELTTHQFAAAVSAVNRSPTPALRLSAAQIARGLRHLEMVGAVPGGAVGAGVLAGYLSVGREVAAAS